MRIKRLCTYNLIDFNFLLLMYFVAQIHWIIQIYIEFGILITSAENRRIFYVELIMLIMIVFKTFDSRCVEC